MNSTEIIEKVSQDSIPFVTPDLSPNAITVLNTRYLKKDENGTPTETPTDMFKRVAKTIADVECTWGTDIASIEKLYRLFYSMMANLDFLPNSPTLMNAGRELGNLSACFVLPIEDSMDSIFETLKQTALIHKSGGGTGFSFSSLRSSGDCVKSSHGVASGPISFMEIYDKATETVKQGGTRRGANMGMLRVNHPDARQFITCKKDTTRLTNFNISIALTDEFMKAVESNSTYNLINPHGNKIVKEENAREIFDLIVKNAHETGEPGIIFIDEVNRKNPIIGSVISSTNPCWTGDTKIWTINGKIPISELVGKEVKVLTQLYDGTLTFRTMHNIRKTNESSKILRVILDNGTSLYCTPNHKLYLKNGIKIEAQNLLPGYRLSSVYRYKANTKGYIKLDNGYEQVLEHWVVGDGKYNRRPDYPNEHCHHIDGNKKNNVPENLEYINGTIHNSARMMGKNNPMFGIWDARNPFFNIPVNGSNNPNYRHDISTEEIISMRKSGKTIKSICDILGCCKYTVQKRIREYKQSICNHKVIKIELLEDMYPVYNGEVDETHSYFVVTGTNGAILSSNCGEQPLLPYESCCLGSINLSNMVKNYNINWKKLSDAIHLSTRFLDNVIEANRFPLSIIEQETKKNRKIGLGVMGFADMLIKLGIPYDSDKALGIADTVMGYIQVESHDESVHLAQLRGEFPNYRDSIYSHGNVICVYMRNATTTTIAPTGTLSIIASCSSGIEPLFALEYTKNVMDGKKLIEVHPELKRNLDFYKVNNFNELPDTIKSVFRVAHDIPVEWHVKMQAAFQRYTDNAVSKTINFPSTATTEDVKKAYLLAYELGCKGVTIYRDGSRSNQVLTTNKDESKTENKEEEVVVSKPRSRPTKTSGTTEKIKTGCGNLYVTVNNDSDGLCEVFCTMGRSGGCTSSQSEAISRLISLALRSKIDLSDIVHQLKGIRCPSPIWQNGKLILSCADAIANSLNSHIESTIESTTHDDRNSFLCPECGEEVEVSEGCFICKHCGYSKCQ